MAPWFKATGLALGLAFMTLSGCKQGEGEICQVSDDCQPGLTCNATTGLCQSDSPINPDDPDAAPTSDAAPTPDAAPAPDATPDAAP